MGIALLSANSNNVPRYGGLEALHLNVNVDPSEQARPPRNFKALVDHYRLKELVLNNNDRKAYSTKKAYESYLKNWIVPDGASTCWRGWKMAFRCTSRNA